MMRLLPVSLLILILLAGFGVHTVLAGEVTVRSAPGVADLEDAMRWYERGVERARSGDMQGALTAIDVATGIEPNLSEAWSARSGILLALGRPAEAAEAARKSIALKNESAVAWSSLASALNGLGKPAEALDASDTAILLDPALASAWVNRAAAAGALGDFPQEIQASEKALSLDPNNVGARQSLEQGRSGLQAGGAAASDGSPATPLPGVIPLCAVILATGFLALRRENS